MDYPINDPNIVLLTDLLAIPAPSGREERMAKAVMDYIANLGHTPQQDAQGNVWVQIAGKNPDLGHIALASHIDELAMVITVLSPSRTITTLDALLKSLVSAFAT